MTLFKKTKTKNQTATAVRPLSASEVAVVSGGINPQPLPPGRYRQI